MPLAAGRSNLALGQELKPQLCKVNPQIVIDIDLDLVLEGVSCGFKLRFLQMVYINRFFVRIDDPVFPDSCVSI